MLKNFHFTNIVDKYKNNSLRYFNDKNFISIHKYGYKSYSKKYKSPTKCINKLYRWNSTMMSPSKWLGCPPIYFLWKSTAIIESRSTPCRFRNSITAKMITPGLLIFKIKPSHHFFLRFWNYIPTILDYNSYNYHMNYTIQILIEIDEISLPN